MKKYIKLLSLTVAVFLSLTLVACNNSKDTSNKNSQNTEKQNPKNAWSNIEKSKEFVVGLCAAYAPFESRNEKTGEIEGFDIDLANSLAKEMGVKAKIVDAEWQALLGGLNKGTYDVLITCMSKKEAAKENVTMSDSYYNLTDIIVVREDDDSIKSSKDLKNKIVGVQLGSGSEQIADKLGNFKEIKRYNYNPEAFIDLKNKRCDAVLVSYPYAVNYMKTQKGYKVINDTLESVEIVIVGKAGEQEMITKFNDALKKIKENGEYDKIIDKWLKIK